MFRPPATMEPLEAHPLLHIARTPPLRNDRWRKRRRRGELAQCFRYDTTWTFPLGPLTASRHGCFTDSLRKAIRGRLNKLATHCALTNKRASRPEMVCPSAGITSRGKPIASVEVLPRARIIRPNRRKGGASIYKALTRRPFPFPARIGDNTRVFTSPRRRFGEEKRETRRCGFRYLGLVEEEEWRVPCKALCGRSQLGSGRASMAPPALRPGPTGHAPLFATTVASDCVSTASYFLSSFCVLLFRFLLAVK